MALKVRLSRQGAKKNPHYAIVVVDGAKKRDGAFLEKLGTYSPKTKVPAEKIKINLESWKAWTAKGAQTSETVTNLIKAMGT